MDIIMTGYAGAAGARKLALEHLPQLLRELPSSVVYSAMGEPSSWDLPDGAVFLGRVKLKEGGVFRALWILSQKLQCGFDIDLRKIPVRQEMVEICEVLNADIYTIAACSGWIAATAKTEAFLDLCRRDSIPACVIGKTTRSMAKVLHLGDAVRYLEGP